MGLDAGGALNSFNRSLWGDDGEYPAVATIHAKAGKECEKIEAQPLARERAFLSAETSFPSVYAYAV
jgi:hypothetical protein